MDNKIVVGVGNIYACESLFKAGISPLKAAGTLTEAECGRLFLSITQVLEAAIIAGGSTLKDYVQAGGEGGYFQHQFQVYGRERQPCVMCSTPILRITQAGRSSFYCPTCQKE
jgi:formamidopyrimidine-DNA glycosylase